jgi:quercetin dioxygenase-like cupin family protein
MTTERRDDGRLRTHPAQRFAPTERKVDIEESFDELLGEAHESTRGHRQITIAHHGSMTLTLFFFEEGSSLPAHKVDGPVTIHVLDGHLEVETADACHQLEDSQVLVLKPGVEHDVRAIEETEMLLTVHLDREHERSTVNQPD